ncbi:Na/Pi symporter [Salirhabdus salicampi]|uniref:Na/Pi symporter n=1 Tax=Salirhabdus salicampi TaxID=476102 RepID=UPI0020C5652F|nr:Na/Pi symporter [Salirhabdus salicampi]MCP8616908.1 Na/Pi symporter [Salirhabdus salicampi]
MNTIFTAFIVYIALFLFGLVILRIGIKLLSYQKMKIWIGKHTANPFKGFLVGVIATGIMQSSSTTLIILISLTATGLIPFRNTIPIILGANVGTTFTVELLAFSNDSLMFFFLFSGLICLFIYRQPIFAAGCISFGIGTIFAAMYGFESLAVPIKEMPAMTDALVQVDTSLSLSMLLGVIVTAIIQSSSAFTGIIMSFMNEHLLSMDSAIAMILGSNIGTCFTAFLASIGSMKEAKWVAYAHIWINILGVIMFWPFIHLLVNISEHLSIYPDRQLAHASFIFNFIVSIVLLPFIKQISSLAKLPYRT